MEIRADVESLADWLQEAGLTGPAYLLFAGLRPLAFVGGQGLLFVQPLLPRARWRSRAGTLADILGDRSRLEMLLTALDARLRGQDGRQGKENA
jgi:hypothetical protein